MSFLTDMAKKALSNKHGNDDHKHHHDDDEDKKDDHHNHEDHDHGDSHGVGTGIFG